MDKAALKAMKLRMLKRVFFPPEVCAGRDAIERLSCLESTARVLLMVSGSAADAGLLDQLGAKCKDAAACEPLRWTSGAPAAPALEAVREQVAAFAPNWIVAVGGGSVLDAAKFVWAQYEHPELQWTGAAAAIPPLRGKARLAAVPTTAGSGSEASQAAVLSNAQGAKVAYVSTEWIPDLVILDPALTVNLPPALTASTGFDALAHAVESAVSSLSHALLRTWSATAVRGVLRHLPQLMAGPQGAAPNLAAREGMQHAAFLGGLCQSTTSTGAAHALSHATTALHHTAHAMATGFYLAPTMEWNLGKNPRLYDDLAGECGLPGGEALVARIRDLARTSGMPADFQQLTGCALSDDSVKTLAAAAAKDVCLKTNACRMTEKDLEDLLRKIG